jgi:HEPN domain-containing protein
MPPDPYVVMLAKAVEDAALAEKLAADPAVTNEHVGFFGQQSVEKALKAVLSYRGVEYRRTHDIGLLLDLLASNGITFPSELQAALALTPYAVEFRYDHLPAEGLAQTVPDRMAAARLGRIGVSWATARTTTPEP